MRPAGRILAAVALAALCGCRAGGPPVPAATGPSLRVGLDRDSAGLGDPVRLRFEAVVPRGSKIALPGAGDSIGAWQVLRASPAATRNAGAWDRWERDLTIAGYRLGSIGPDTIRVRGVTASGESLRLATVPAKLVVGGVMRAGEPADPSRAKDIRDVVSTGSPRWPYLLAGGLALLAAAAWFARRVRARRRAPAEEAAPPGPTPEEEFEAAIERLLASGILERGLYREFYYDVSRAVRLYLERTSGLPLLESTSSEVMDLLAGDLRGTAEEGALRDWLAEGDLVKYARMERLQAEAMRYLERSRELVRRLARRREPAAAAAAVAAGEAP